MPEAILVAAFWSLSGNAKLAEEWRDASGADHMVTKIQGAVTLCEELLANASGLRNANPSAEQASAGIVYENSMQFGEELESST